jgi:hypothetical protein
MAGSTKNTQKRSLITSKAVCPRHTGPLINVMTKYCASSRRKRYRLSMGIGSNVLNGFDASSGAYPGSTSTSYGASRNQPRHRAIRCGDSAKGMWVFSRRVSWSGMSR